ncbi:phytoene desaturase [Planctomonas sp. JC2975]|uniref:phytoene desaturase family protein n=1 Tax=Planctomonas sp. JC2975 TaxID=2729626 RepID=UPI001475F76F|nr:phytoene desaturase family protein [Planctomonas sp. JC2975]NNC12689.1 phytoene desaturase [Planctomonas sp. JC2975]
MKARSGRQRHDERGAATRTIVIGGGIAGIATAALLARDGHSVTLLEASSTLGGRVGTWSSGGFRFDTGPSWYLMPEVFEHFYRMLGTEARAELDLVELDPGYRVFYEGQPEPVDVPKGRARVRELFEEFEAGSGPALDAFLDSAADTYDLALRRFLYTSFESKRSLLSSDLLARSPRLTRMLLRSLEEHTARSFTDPRLRQLLEYPAVFLGSSPAMTPALYHLMSHLDLDAGVLYPRGGFRSIIDGLERLAESAGVAIIRGARATRILTREDGTATLGQRAVVRGVLYRHDGVDRIMPADVVVSAADLHHSETSLLPERLQTYPEPWWQRRTAGPGAVLLMAGVRGQLPRLAHHTLFFTREWQANFNAIFHEPTHVPDPASIYVCRPSATDPSVAPEGHDNLFVLVPVPADPSIGIGGIDGTGSPAVEAVADAAIRQIATWAGIPDLADRIVVRRTLGPGDFELDLHAWRGTALGPAHTLRQSAFLRAGNISKRVAGLYYAGGSTLPGIGLPMCLISAELVLKRLRGDRSTSPSPEPVAAGEMVRE